jgi:hypothetical protein
VLDVVGDCGGVQRAAPQERVPGGFVGRFIGRIIRVPELCESLFSDVLTGPVFH